MKTLRKEIDRLGKGSHAQFSDHSVNQKRLLEMIKDLKEEFDVTESPVGGANLSGPEVDSPVVVLCSRLVISVGRESLSHSVTCLMSGMTRLFMLSWMVSLTSLPQLRS